MIKSHSIFITTVIGGVSIVAWVVGGWIDRPSAMLILGVLFGSFVGVAIALIALATSRPQHTQTRYVERQQPAQERPQPQKQLPASTTRYTVVNAPSARLPQARGTIGTKARKQIEVKR